MHVKHSYFFLCVSWNELLLLLLKKAHIQYNSVLIGLFKLVK